MSNVREFDVSNETGGNTAGDERPVGSWASVLYMARKEVRKKLIYNLVAVAVVLTLGVAAAFIFGVISGSPSDSSPAASLNYIFLICIGILPITSAWYSGHLSNARRAISSESHIAFLKTLPLTFGQIVAAHTLVAVCSVLVLLSLFLGSFYALSEPLRDELGVGGLFLFASFWIGGSLVFESIGLFAEVGLRGKIGVYVYIVPLGFLAGVAVGVLGAEDVNVVTWVIEFIQSRGALPGIAVLFLGSVLLGLSWLATTWRLNRKGVGS